MNKKIWLPVIVVVLVLMTLPIILSALMHIPLLKYALGSADGWLSYWGGYLGAIIGASVVYIVSKIQIEKQGTLQLQALEKENEMTLQREIKQYYFQLELEKLESFYEEISDFLKITTNGYNEFVMYISHTHILQNKQDMVDKELHDRLVEEIRLIRLNLVDWTNEGHTKIFTLKRLSMYTEASQSIIMSIEKQFGCYVDEVKEVYKDNQGYKKYLNKRRSGESVNLIESKEIIDNLINHLSRDILQPELQGKINEMRKSQAPY